MDDDWAPVEMVLLFTDLGESDIVHAHIPDGSEILELGCGTGRMTRRLLELGHPVTGVDYSEGMLRHAPEGATKVLADTETLDLGRTFPVVLLASNVLNINDAETRHRLLASCKRHLSEDGQVVLQRWNPTLDSWVTDVWEPLGDNEMRVSSLEGHGSEFSATIEYRAGGRIYGPFLITPALLDDALLQEEANQVGLVLSETLTEDQCWVVLRHLR